MTTSAMSHGTEAIRRPFNSYRRPQGSIPAQGAGLIQNM